MSATPTLRLRITPVPRPLFGLNLRKIIGKGRWRKIRKALLEENGCVCAICGAEPEDVRQIHGHEEWVYDTSTTPAVARLNGITLHCWLCHGVEHYLLAMKLAALGYEEQERLIVQHFCDVNGADEDLFAKHLSEAMAIWSPLCDLEWTVDYRDYTNLVAIRAAAQEKWRARRAGGSECP